MNFEQYAQYKSDNATDSGLSTQQDDPLEDWKKSQYLKELDTISGSSDTFGLGSGLNNTLSQEELIARKQERVSAKVADLSKDDSNFTIKMKEAYNTVNNLWDGQDLKATVLGKEHTMSNKIFEDVNATSSESEARKKELIDQYNTAVDDPNAKHKVYQLRLQDGIDENGNPIYTYKTGIAETSAAERYKNQMIKGGYEILSEKGFAGAEDWENKWHGLKSNMQDRTFDEGYNADGKNIKSISGFGAGYSEIYNTGHFDNGQTQEELIANKLNSQALAESSAQRRRDGYGRGSDSSIDAFQAGGLKVLADTGDTVLDLVTPGDNTWLNGAKDQGNIDKYVGYNRKTADKAIGEATGYFKQGDYASAMWEVLKNPQITAESLPANLEMVVGFGKFTAVGKAASAIAEARKLGNVDEAIALTKKAADEITTSQKIIHNVAKNAGFYAQVAAQTNNQLEERVLNNQAAGMTGGDSLPEAAAVFASNYLSLGLDKIAFGKITGIGGGKKSLADAYGFANPDGKKSLLNGVLNQAYKMAENGATEAAQEYVQTWDEILNKELGTGKHKTLSDVFGDKANQDEAIGAMLAGSAGGIHMGIGGEVVGGIGEKAIDVATGGAERRESARLDKEDSAELKNIISDHRTADNLAEGHTPEQRVSASKATALSVARNGHKAILGSILSSPEVLDGDVPSIENSPAAMADKFIKAVANEYKDTTGAGSSAASKTMMNNNISSFIGNLMNGMNDLKWDEKFAKPIYEDAIAKGVIDSSVDINKFMSDKIDKQKLEISKAIGTSLDSSGIDISNTVIDKFKHKYIVTPLNDAKKRTRKESGDATEVAQNLNDLANKNIEVKGVDPKLTKEEASDMRKQAYILYAIGGNKDSDLADLIDQIESQAGNEYVTINKTAMNVATDVLRNGSQFGKQSKKSIVQHNEDISGSIADSIESVEAGADDKVVSKKLSSAKKNIDDILSFAASRTQGDTSYVSKEDIEKLKNESDVSSAIKNHIVNKINSTPVGKFKSRELDKDGNPILKDENPIVVFEKNEKARLDNAKVDKGFQERFGVKNNTRDIIAGATKNGMISSFIYENTLIVKELNKSIEELTNLKNSLIKAGKEDSVADIDAQIKTATDLAEHITFMNEVYKQVHLNSNYRLKDANGNFKKDQYIKQVIVPGEEFIDPEGVKRIATIKDIAIAMQNDKTFQNRMNEKKNKVGLEEEKDLSVVVDTLEQEIEDEFGVDLNSDTNTLFENTNDFISDSSSEYFIETDSNAVNSAESIKKLYEKVINNKLIKKFKKIIQKTLDAEYTGFRSTKDSKLFTGMISYLDGQFNDINYSHEMFHAMSYLKLEQKLGKKDREFVDGIKNVLKDLDISTIEKFNKLVDGRKSERLYQDIMQLQSSIVAENNLFEKELAAILYSNADARKFIVNAYDNSLESNSRASKRKDMADFIKAVFKAYQEIVDMLKEAFSGDKDNGVNTKSDAYRAMVKFVGNSLKQEAARTNTYNDMKSEYDNISNKFDVDKTNIDLIDKDGNSFLGTLRSKDSEGKSLNATYTIKGKTRSINSTGVNSLIAKFNNQTLTAIEMDKLNQVIKAYDDRNISIDEANSNIDSFYDLKKKNKEKNENKKPEQSEGDQNETQEPEIRVLENLANDLESVISKSDGSGRNFGIVSTVASSINDLENPTEETIKDIEAIIQIVKELNKCKGE